jgi:nitrogen fixation-related uncharacterized protein
VNYQRSALILLTLYLGASVILGTLAWRVDHNQQDDIEAAQQRIRATQQQSRKAICAAAEVIRREPQGAPAYDEGETETAFVRRLAGYRIFLAGAELLDCEEVD